MATANSPDMSPAQLPSDNEDGFADDSSINGDDDYPEDHYPCPHCGRVLEFDGSMMHKRHMVRCKELRTQDAAAWGAAAAAEAGNGSMSPADDDADDEYEVARQILHSVHSKTHNLTTLERGIAKSEASQSTIRRHGGVDNRSEEALAEMEIAHPILDHPEDHPSNGRTSADQLNFQSSIRARSGKVSVTAEGTENGIEDPDTEDIYGNSEDDADHDEEYNDEENGGNIADDDDDGPGRDWGGEDDISDTRRGSESSLSALSDSPSSDDEYGDKLEHMPFAYVRHSLTQYPISNRGQENSEVESGPRKFLDFPTITDFEKFSASLANAEQMDQPTLYSRLENIQAAMSMMQEEFIVNSLRITDLERSRNMISGKEPDRNHRLADVVNPRLPKGNKHVREDLKESFIYGYEHNTHPSKIGLQDPIAQRIGGNGDGRSLRHRVPTKKIVEGDASSGVDSDDTRDSSSRPRRQVRGTPGISSRPNSELPDESSKGLFFPSGKRRGRPPANRVAQLQVEDQRPAKVVDSLLPEHAIQETSRPGRSSSKLSAQGTHDEAIPTTEGLEGTDAEASRAGTPESTGSGDSEGRGGRNHPGARKRKATSDFDGPSAKVVSGKTTKAKAKSKKKKKAPNQARVDVAAIQKIPVEERTEEQILRLKVFREKKGAWATRKGKDVDAVFARFDQDALATSSEDDELEEVEAPTVEAPVPAKPAPKSKSKKPELVTKTNGNKSGQKVTGMTAASRNMLKRWADKKAAEQLGREGPAIGRYKKKEGEAARASSKTALSNNVVSTAAVNVPSLSGTKRARAGEEEEEDEEEGGVNGSGGGEHVGVPASKRPKVAPHDPGNIVVGPQQGPATAKQRRGGRPKAAERPRPVYADMNTAPGEFPSYITQQAQLQGPPPQQHFEGFPAPWAFNPAQQPSHSVPQHQAFHPQAFYGRSSQYDQPVSWTMIAPYEIPPHNQPTFPAPAPIFPQPPQNGEVIPRPAKKRKQVATEGTGASMLQTHPLEPASKKSRKGIGGRPRKHPLPAPKEPPAEKIKQEDDDTKVVRKPRRTASTNKLSAVTVTEDDDEETHEAQNPAHSDPPMAQAPNGTRRSQRARKPTPAAVDAEIENIINPVRLGENIVGAPRPILPPSVANHTQAAPATSVDAPVSAARRGGRKRKSEESAITEASDEVANANRHPPKRVHRRPARFDGGDESEAEMPPAILPVKKVRRRDTTGNSVPAPILPPSHGRKVSVYEEYLALSSPTHNPLGKRGKRASLVQHSDQQLLDEQLTEYERFQALTASPVPGSTPVDLGKRKRKPVVDLAQIMAMEQDGEEEES